MDKTTRSFLVNFIGIFSILIGLLFIAGCHEPTDGEVIDGVKYYLHWNGEVKTKLTITDDGKRNGPAWYYYDNGTLEQEANFVNDTLDGELMNYNEGQLRSTMSYDNGKLEGPYIGYHQNGELQCKGQYVNGLAEGTWYFYKDDGTLELEAGYRNGNRDSYIEYYPSGQIERRSAQIDVWSSSSDAWQVNQIGTIGLSTQNVYASDSAKVILEVVSDFESFDIADSTINGIAYHDFVPKNRGKYVITASITDWANSPEVIFYACDTLIIEVK